MKTLHKPILILFFQFFIANVYSSEIIVSCEQKRYDISQNLTFFIDSTSKMTIEQVASGETKHLFNQKKIPYQPEETAQAYWISFTVRNTCPSYSSGLLLEIWNTDIDSLECYIPNSDGTYNKKTTGFFKPFSSRPIINTNFIFVLNIPTGDSCTYYVKIWRHYPMQFVFHLSKMEELINHSVLEYWCLGIFYGSMLLILLFNLYLFISIRKKIYLYYLLCVVTEILYCLGRDGMGFQFLWPTYPDINAYAHHYILQFFLIVFSLNYAKEFLQLKERLPFYYTLANIAIVIKGILSIGLHMLDLDSPFIIYALDTFIMLIPLIAGVRLYLQGDTYIRYYIVGFAFLFFGLLLTLLNERSWLPDSDLNWYLINIGMMLEVLFLGIALIEQISTMQIKHQTMYAQNILKLEENELIKYSLREGLEEKVAERSRVLKEMKSMMELKALEMAAIHENIQSSLENLKQINGQLKSNFNNVSKNLVLLKEVNIDEFKQLFPDDNSCLQYLSVLKWNSGFICKKCSSSLYSSGKISHSRRCKTCNYDESPTTGTLFHKLKFPLQKAFYLTYLVSFKLDTKTLDELSEILDLRRETCWSFKQKIDSASQKISPTKTKDGWETLALITLHQ